MISVVEICSANTMKQIIFALIPLIGGLLLVNGDDLDPMCPYPSENLTYFPNPDNCSQFFECFEGKKFVMSCPTNLVWNDKVQVCDYQSNVDCSAYTWAPTGPTTPSSPTGPTTPSSPTGFTPDPHCPYPSDKIIYDVNPNNCKQFYECYQGVRYSMTCPENLYWNHKMNYCDDLENVDCTRGKTTSPPSPPTPPTAHPTPIPGISCEDKTDGSYYAHPTDRTKFYECVSGKPIIFTCPGGTEWKEEYLTCVNI